MRELLAIIRLRTLFASLLPALLLPVLVLTWWLGPWSPMAVERADQLAADGEWAQAVEAYQAVSVYGTDPSARGDALYRGGTVAATAGLNQTAARLLRRFSWNFPNDPRRDEALARLGTVLASLEQPTEAARAYERSLDHEPTDPAPRHLRAGDLWLQAGRPWLAWSHWERAAEDPAHARQAWVRMARARLEAGDFQGADEVYVLMLDSGVEGAWWELATLGRAVCAEGLGEYDAALVQLDELDGPVADRRRVRVLRRDPR